uniref:IST1 homolog n=1 Tax=Prolemur simus TaxID=1328070 RepID=A0A8C8YZY2_PROSS
MLGSGFKAERLRVNLRLVINRLKLLEKKKTELAQKARKEIADYLAAGKDERARIRVEHIIREDYLVEAMEILELYCDLLLARFGLIQSMKELDSGLAESVSTLIWAAPRLQSEVAELKIVADQLCAKYSKEYGKLCRTNQIGTVNDRLMHKLSVEAPPKILVERYLIEIAKNYNVPYEPDSVVMVSLSHSRLTTGDSVARALAPGSCACPFPVSVILGSLLVSPQESSKINALWRELSEMAEQLRRAPHEAFQPCVGVPDLKTNPSLYRGIEVRESRPWCVFSHALI